MATYNIIGNDQKQYGPVTQEELRRWIAEGRVNAQSSAKGESDAEWRPLSTFPEFAAAFAVPSALPGAPPALSATATPPAGKTSALAITSLVLGILGVFTCGLTAVAGLILGIIAMNKVKNSQGRLEGQGLALAGTIVSGVFIVIGLLMILPAMLLPALAAAKDKAREINCLSNEKHLALAVRLYSGDHTNQMPAAANWCDALRTYVGADKPYQCPAGDAAQRCHYAFNAKLGGVDDAQINPQTVLLFETQGGWNLSGGPELMLSHPRHGHGRMVIVAFADGHVEAVTGSRLDTLRWDP